MYVTTFHRLSIIGLLFTAASTSPTSATAPDPYPVMLPLKQYLMATRTQEIMLARSAAPDSISAHADVMVLGSRGYESAAKGTNGFVCLVVRAWDANFSSNDFWNPKTRAPICFNAAAARTVLKTYYLRTQWALAGTTKPAMITKDKASLASGEIKQPEAGSMSYMLSKNGYLGDEPHGPWRPHVMFLVPRTPAAQWGANVHGSPVMADDESDDGMSVFFVVVAKWSDGTPGPV